MSASRSTRPYSPAHYYPADGSRATTGNFFVTSFDTKASTGQQKPSDTAKTSRPSVVYEAQPMRKSTYNDGKTSKTEYAIRPRHNSTTETKRPLSISTGNNSPPRRGSAVVAASPRELSSPGPAREDAGRFLQPASTYDHLRHQRHNSTTRSDLEKHDARGSRDKKYHPRGPARPHDQKVYLSSRPPPRIPEDEGWSYTGPREQFDRDYPQRNRESKEDQSRRERPYVYESDRTPGRREIGPPPSASRQLERIEKPDSGRYIARTAFDAQPERTSDLPKRRNSTRNPVLHQQQTRDDGYSSARDDYDSRAPPRARRDRNDDGAKPKERPRDVRESDRDRDRDRDYRRDYDREPERDRVRDHDRGDRPSESRRKQRSRENSPERSGLKTFAATALSGLAAAGLTNSFRGESKKEESETDDTKDRKHKRHRRPRRDDDRDDDPADDEIGRKDERRRSRRYDESNSDTPEDQPQRRNHSRRRERPDDGHERRSDSEQAQPGRRASKATPREDDETASEPDRLAIEAPPAYKPDVEPMTMETRTMSPGENEDDRPRRVQLVEPVKDKEELRPRGILKPARQVPFPEDPNPIREGVAPLKDATKEGIPPNARWTKINRVLVNPEALEKYHERFEEREDYVIVLRVLSREEIQKLAEKTKEVREARELEWQRKLDERRTRQNKDTDDESTYTDHPPDDEDAKPQLAIEAPPTGAPVDFHNLQNQHNQQRAQIPDVVVDNSNYSQYV